MLRPILITACLVALPALAQEDEENLPIAVQAREGHMKAYALHLGALGAMAKGEMEYDAEMASAHASELAALAGLAQTGYWPEGTSSEDIEGSRALPAIWSDMDDFKSKMNGLHEAAMALEGAAGGGAEQLQAAFGGVGQACGACHKTYRAEEE